MSFAVAEPSIEAWLFCEPSAFADALSEMLEVPFRKPAEWPMPRTESQAKEYLGRLIHDGAGAHLPLAGFEYSAEVVRRTRPEAARNASLAAWARELRRLLVVP